MFSMGSIYRMYFYTTYALGLNQGTEIVCKPTTVAEVATMGFRLGRALDHLRTVVRTVINGDAIRIENNGAGDDDRGDNDGGTGRRWRRSPIDVVFLRRVIELFREMGGLSEVEDAYRG